MERISLKEIPQEMMQRLMSIEAYINNSSIGLKLLEIMRLRVSQINGCAYCIDMHYKELKHLGESELRLCSLIVWRETNYFTDREMAVLRFTEEVTKLTEKPVDDDNYLPLEKFFSKDEITIITLAIAQINTWTRLMKTFRITPGKYKVAT